ncbi:DUF6064 family protein [Bradyrhizobium septentrionale]|uniref:DUF6064 family protein n=1 Tax=Bradyrhizobium septentrionale TaxID=1404411 RepID=A0ABZ2P3W4_9BRAD
MLPFTPEQFLGVFVNYNQAIWPIQITAYVLGALSIALLFRRTRAVDRVITGVLAAMWLWTGVAYHALSFSAINNAAYIFAALFVVQGCCLVYAGVYRDQIRFGLRPILATGVGISLVAYAAVAYPLIGLATGHRYPEMPMFGVTPCPVTIFTFGMLLLTVRPVPNWLLVIPFVWSLIGGSAAVLLNVPQDWFLLVSGFITSLLMFFRDRYQAATG